MASIKDHDGASLNLLSTTKKAQFRFLQGDDPETVPGQQPARTAWVLEVDSNQATPCYKLRILDHRMTELDLVVDGLQSVQMWQRQDDEKLERAAPVQTEMDDMEEIAKAKMAFVESMNVYTFMPPSNHLQPVTS